MYRRVSRALKRWINSGRSQTGGPFTSHLLHVHDADISHAPSSIIEQAERVVLDLFAAIGVEIHWSDAPSALLVILRDDEPGDLRRASQTVLGAAIHTPNGSVAYVFYRRVEEQADRYVSTPASILGSAMAHEVGHLLLPTRGHSRDGLMRGCWEYREFQQAATHQLQFSPDEGASIRARAAHVISRP